MLFDTFCCPLWHFYIDLEIFMAILTHFGKFSLQLTHICGKDLVQHKVGYLQPLFIYLNQAVVLSIDRIWKYLLQQSHMYLLDIKSSPSPSGRSCIFIWPEQQNKFNLETKNHRKDTGILSVNTGLVQQSYPVQLTDLVQPGLFYKQLRH